MMAFSGFVRQYRGLLLVVLVATVFVNWYFYNDLRNYCVEGMQGWALIAWLETFLSERTVYLVVIKGSVFILSLIINSLLSFSIIYVFFNQKTHLIKVGGIIILVYAGIIIVGQVLAYIFSIKALFIKFHFALHILISPLMEAALIPILQLYEKGRLENESSQEEG